VCLNAKVEPQMTEPTFNPYQSPAASLRIPLPAHAGEEAAHAGYRLYSLRSIGLATFLGSPIAGGVVMAVNYRRLDRLGAAIQAVVWSTAFTVAMLACVMFQPDDLKISKGVYMVLQVSAMYYAGKQWQGPLIETHQRLGGRMISAWGAAGIGLLTAMFLLGAIFGVVMLLPEDIW
jgi:hypothetical protein